MAFFVSTDRKDFLKKLSYMRKMHKIINIALLFILIRIFLCQGIAYPTSDFYLRIPSFFQYHARKEEIKNISVHLKENKNANSNAIKLEIIGDIVSNKPNRRADAFLRAAKLGYRFAALESTRYLRGRNMQISALIIYLFNGLVPDIQTLSFFNIDSTEMLALLQNLEKENVVSYNGLRWRFYPIKTGIPEGIYRSLYACQDLMFNDLYLIDKDRGLNKNDITWFRAQSDFRQIVIAQMVSRTKFGNYLLGLLTVRPDTYSLFHLRQFEDIWSSLEPRLSSDTQNLSIESKLNLLAEDEEGRRLIREAVFQPRHATHPDRFAVEDIRLKTLLIEKGIDPAQSMVLDQGSSSMVTSERLRKYLGGTVIAMDIVRPEEIILRPGGRKVRSNDDHNYIPKLNDRLQFRQSNMATDFHNDLAGRVNVIRHANVLHYLNRDEFSKTVGNVFRYAARNPQGLLYHVSKSDTSHPGLFDQLIFDIKGKTLADWKLTYVGYLSSATNKEHNPSFSLKERTKLEDKISKRVIKIHQMAHALILSLSAQESLVNILDSSGQITPAIQTLLFNYLSLSQPKNIDEELMAMILNDILQINPWRSPREYTGTYYRDNRIMVPHELAWDYTDSPRDLNQLLDNLIKYLNQKEHPAKMNHINQCYWNRTFL